MKALALAIVVSACIAVIFLRQPNPNPVLVTCQQKYDSLKLANDSLYYEILELKDERDHLKEEVSMLKVENTIPEEFTVKSQYHKK